MLPGFTLEAVGCDLVVLIPPGTTRVRGVFHACCAAGVQSRGASAVEDWIDNVDADVMPIMFNSWMLTYFTHEARAKHISGMRRLVQERGLVWVSAEGRTFALMKDLIRREWTLFMHNMARALSGP